MSSDWVIRSSDEVSATLGEFAFGERTPILSIGPRWERWCGVLSVTGFLGVMAWSAYNSWAGGYLTGEDIAMRLIFGGMFAALGVGYAIRWGWLPFIYDLGWSPAGLEASLFRRRFVFPPGSRVRVNESWPPFMLIRSPRGRWVPVPRRILESIASPALSDRLGR